MCVYTNICNFLYVSVYKREDIILFTTCSHTRTCLFTQTCFSENGYIMTIHFSSVLSCFYVKRWTLRPYLSLYILEKFRLIQFCERRFRQHTRWELLRLNFFIYVYNNHHQHKFFFVTVDISKHFEKQDTAYKHL